MRLSKMLRDKRLKSGLTQAELGEALGYRSGQFVSSWEKGMSRPPKEKVLPLCRLLGLSEAKLETALIEDKMKKVKTKWAQEN